VIAHPQIRKMRRTTTSKESCTKRNMTSKEDEEDYDF
jgi:hypothetical protein